MNILFVIPARGGSKGIPGKNIKELNGKPLIYYSIEFARLFTGDENICVSSDSEEIINSIKKIGLRAPFVRPAALATDTAGSYEVLQHALAFYDAQQKKYDILVLLQPTSPLRKKEHLQQALAMYDSKLDMLVSVKKSKSNPYYNLFEENQDGYLVLSKGEGDYQRRQDIPEVFEFNGSIYIINAHSLQSYKSFKDFKFIKKYTMDDEYSIDLDTPSDWEYLEYLLKKKSA
ncbi:MAG TPA: acylneuraminate cytidylyltransferase family protein [Puia sp.]|nr:acylneuraminate cytidylyltransferase family protein [Puia sp.]